MSPYVVNGTVDGGTYQFNGKYDALKYLSLDGTFVANYAVGSSTDFKNPIEHKLGAYSLWDQDDNVQTTSYTQGKSVEGPLFLVWWMC